MVWSILASGKFSISAPHWPRLWTNQKQEIENGLSYKKVVEKRENLANPLNPAALPLNNIPIEEKLPKWLIDKNNEQMEFECDQNTGK